jgi:hypothetical protein
VELDERVRVSAEKHAVLALDTVTMVVPSILGVPHRECNSFRTCSLLLVSLRNSRMKVGFDRRVRFLS